MISHKHQVICDNKYITFTNKPFCWQNRLQKWVQGVQDLLGDDGEF